ncbi:2-keto-4-pentenoate hydratase/2-oxohepta-3-ene-1,7-dioic acid hydratase in catechol pathway [Actinoplanes tereljensis]|uniref:Fumarylacetoacetate (FAA) hydrolase n=1 Tax=Paractinoplanes tereljensis TaxID=571912 RepID=A0A919NSV5_9ACTN|nr:fumarylacetoacetate hydrolase family protein [Actinoplanes tereljensis]GIF23177.1 fumarylacetoacetate (FAA) hydrolase [Actinoplanes tereljensis]
MSVNVARTAGGWWVEAAGRLTRIATSAATTRELLADRAAVEAAAASPDPDGPAAGAEVLLSPVTTPARVVAQMVNYRSHSLDSGFDPDRVPAAFFRKASGSVSGPGADIVRPEHVGFLDYEVELGLVIARRLEIGTVVDPGLLPRYVAGLVVTNDVSARDVQLTKTQFYEAKSYPTFTPVGPYLTLVDADDLAVLDEVRLTLSVNGVQRQDSTVADMLVKPAAALTALARFQTMEAGDLLLTGTPGGTALKAPPPLVNRLAGLLSPAKRLEIFFKRQATNPRYLQDGDVVAASITLPGRGLDLGTQTNVVRAK